MRRNAWEFLKLTLRPVPGITTVVGYGMSIVGLTAAAIVGWILTPSKHPLIVGRKAIRMAGHIIVLPGEPHWPYAVAGVVLVALLLTLLAGSKLVASAKVLPRLTFAGTDSAPAQVYRLAGGFATGVSGPMSATTSPTIVHSVLVTPLAGASAAVAPHDVATRRASSPNAGEGFITSPASPVNDYVRVLVKNEPHAVYGETAKRVAGRVEFFDDYSGAKLLEMQGRWAEAKQRGETGQIGISNEAVQIDIDANGVPHALDIAMQTRPDKVIYAVNDENASSPDHRLESHRLGVDRCRVRVTLLAANCAGAQAAFLLSRSSAGDLVLEKRTEAIDVAV